LFFDRQQLRVERRGCGNLLLMNSIGERQRGREILMSVSDYSCATTATATSATMAAMDVELVHNDDEGEDEGRVYTRLHQHVEYALLYQDVLQRRIPYHLLNQTSDRVSDKC
jgi:hypothetical protein